MKKIKENKIAIKVEGVSKTFCIPHEKVSTVKDAFIGALKNGLKNRTYEKFKALDDVSFEVKKGEFFGIIGRNGSGKSTLLKILAGIYSPDKGKVQVNGMISPFLELGIGFNPELSGRDNIYLNGTVLGLTEKEIDEKFDSIVKFSELERFIDQKLKNYSSGMQMRLAFSVSIHANRDILLMDEVLAVGDTNFKSKCLEEFNKYRKFGRTVLIVTHDTSVVERYCDRALLLRNGKAEKIGRAKKVAHEYIYQNLADEEHLIVKEAKSIKKEQIKDRGSREVEIHDVEMYDCNDNKKSVFISGSKVNIRIKYKINTNESIDDLIFGLGIHLRNNSQYCFAINSFIDKKKFSTDMPREGFLEIEIPELSLNKGEYYINAIVSKQKINFEKPIHFIGEIRNFNVRNLNYNEGLFCVKHFWK